ncbi:MAG: transglutaminase domain-containing protein [Planctomycetota bacterium]
MLPIAMFALALLAPEASDVDTDGDGLSDFAETHKYFTDPRRADSDGDGIPDGDWRERREYAYTVRSIVQVMPPVTPDIECDDYQDARVLYRTDAYVEIEVIHYPFNTVASAIELNPRWRDDAAAMTPWVAPGPTADWNATMQAELVAALARDGIDARALDDRTLVERASHWLLRHAHQQDGFSTYCAELHDGKVQVRPQLLESAAQVAAAKGLSIAEQWQRELFASGMFEHATRGSCTSTAIYLNGCLRALGIPTRLVLAIPVVDASDQRELEMVERQIENASVRRMLCRALTPLKDSWSSHTFNEVFVGGRWRRLNGDRLGQNILDQHLFGLITHVATMSDWVDLDFAATWGTRSVRRPTDDVFGGQNPYSAITLSDQLGAHATPPVTTDADPDEITQLTIERAYWYDSKQRAPSVTMRLDDPDTAGHVLVHVREGRAGVGASQYRGFYDRVGKDFVLRADGRADVPLKATRGYWAHPEAGVQEFYLRIEPEPLAAMAPGVAYSLIARNNTSGMRWLIADGVTLTRPDGAASASSLSEMVIDSLMWSDSSDSPLGGAPGLERSLLMHVGTSDHFAEHKAFTAACDRVFFLEAEGVPPIEAATGVGGVTGCGQSWVILSARGGGFALEPGVEYTLRPRNQAPRHRWKLLGTLTITR